MPLTLGRIHTFQAIRYVSPHQSRSHGVDQRYEWRSEPSGRE